MFNKYPWTDYNGQNWNWILEELKKVSEDVDELKSDFAGFNPEEVEEKLEELTGKVAILEERANNLAESDASILNAISTIRVQMRVVEFNNKNLVVNSNFNRLISRTGNTAAWPFDGWFRFDEQASYTAYERVNEKFVWRMEEISAGENVAFIQPIVTPFRAAGLTAKLFGATGTVEAILQDIDPEGDSPGVLVGITGNGSFSGIVVAPGDYSDIAPIAANYIPKSNIATFNECSTVMYKTPVHAHFNGYITENTKVVASVPCSAIFADALNLIMKYDNGISHVQVTVCTVDGFSPVASYDSPATVTAVVRDYEYGANSVNVEFQFSSAPGTNNTPCSVVLRGSSAMYFVPQT